MNKLWNDRSGRSKNRWRLLPLVAILALGLAGMGANAAAAGKPPVPFKASVSGTVTIVNATDFVLAGTGGSSQMHNISYEANGELTSPVTDTLIETLTAANGDTLTIRCEQALETLGNGVLHGTDTWEVTGGTGQFEGATGSGTGDTYVHDLSTFTKHFTGTITYEN